MILMTAPPVQGASVMPKKDYVDEKTLRTPVWVVLGDF